MAEDEVASRRKPKTAESAAAVEKRASLEPPCEMVRVTMARSEWDARHGCKRPPLEYCGPDTVRTIDLMRDEWFQWLKSVMDAAVFEIRDGDWRGRWTNAPRSLDRRQTQTGLTNLEWRFVAVREDLLDWQTDIYRGNGFLVQMSAPFAKPVAPRSPARPSDRKES